MIDPNILRYAERHTSPDEALLSELERETHLKTLYPQMLAGSYQGKLLEMISIMIRPRYILEIGTFTGYSAICLAKGLIEGGRMWTVEVDPEPLAIAERYFQKAGIAGKVEVIEGDALNVVPALDKVFDLVYIDGAKEHYSDYYKIVFPKVRPGGFLIADNVLWGGKVVEENAGKDKETEGIVRFNELVVFDPRIETVMLTVRDGLMVGRKK